MTTPCDPMCPFPGCASCEFSGGEIPAAATVSDARTGVADAIIRGTKTAPGGASTPLVQGPRPSDLAEGLTP